MLDKYRLLSVVLLVVFCFVYVGCAKTKGAGVKESDIKKPQISHDVTKEAQVTNFQYYLKDWEKEKTLFYKITIKNVSKENHRFRVIISIPEGDSVGGLLPDTPSGKFEPGKEMSAEYPVIGNSLIPEKIEISVILMQ